MSGISELAALFQTCTATCYGWQVKSDGPTFRITDPQWLQEEDHIRLIWKKRKQRRVSCSPNHYGQSRRGLAARTKAQQEFDEANEAARLREVEHHRARRAL